MARFKIFWTVAGLSIAGFIITLLFTNSESPIFQNDTVNSIKAELSRNVENKLMGAYNSTLKEYGKDATNVLDPCDMAESFGDIKGLSKCDESNEP